MPTIEEVLQTTLESALTAATQSCWCCGGVGHAVNYDGELSRTKCPEGVCVVYATTVCTECQGEGFVTATPNDNFVAVVVYGAAIGMMLRSRGRDDFDRVNRILDWLGEFTAWQVSVIPDGVAQKALEDFGDALSSSPLRKTPANKSTQGQLSNEELEQLLGPTGPDIIPDDEHRGENEASDLAGARGLPLPED